MTTVTILPEPTDIGDIAYRAIAGTQQSVGKTAGEALDALTALLPDDKTGTLVIVQNLRPDHFFEVEKQERLKELMACWRAARDSGASLSADEQAELSALVDLEVRAAIERGEMIHEVTAERSEQVLETAYREYYADAEDDLRIVRNMRSSQMRAFKRNHREKN